MMTVETINISLDLSNIPSGFIAVLSLFLSGQDGLLVVADSSERAILPVTDVPDHYFSLSKDK